MDMWIVNYPFWTTLAGAQRCCPATIHRCSAGLF